VTDPAGDGRKRWTPRARGLAAGLFAIAAIAGFLSALLGAVCDMPGLDCLRNEGKDAIRVAVIVAPFLAYALYRFSRGRGGARRPPGD
jgi:hypothetical protein